MSEQKMFIDVKTMKQEKIFDYLGYTLSGTNNNMEFQVKINKFHKICGTIRKTLD